MVSKHACSVHFVFTRLSTRGSLVLQIINVQATPRLCHCLANWCCLAWISQVRTISLFGEVWGIGPATALKLYEKGHRTLDDLKNEESLTNSQKIGLKYFQDIKTRIPRHEVSLLWFSSYSQLTWNIFWGLLIYHVGRRDGATSAEGWRRDFAWGKNCIQFTGFLNNLLLPLKKYFGDICYWPIYFQ